MTSTTENQMQKSIRDVVDAEIELYGKRRTITAKSSIPDTTDIPIEDPLRWFRVHDVICVYVDMVDSTKLSASTHENGTAGVYRLFTNTAIRIFHEYDAPYIDVKGDGVFALFNSNQKYRALVAAVSFKTFAECDFVPRVEKVTDLRLGAHIGIAQRTVLVRKLGLKSKGGRSDRQNEVWAGKPVNMASKLAAKSNAGELFACDKYYHSLKDSRATYSCGCNGGAGAKTALWHSVDVSTDDRFDFDTAYKLTPCWCPHHGREFAEGLLKADS